MTTQRPAYTLPRPAAGDIVDLIVADHRLFEELLRDLRDQTADQEAARAAFADLLIAHAEAEEQEVYPHLKSKRVIPGEEEEHGEKEHAAGNECLLDLLRAKGTDTQKYEDALEKMAESLNHHIAEEETSILNPARTEASEELRQRLGAAWSKRRNALLDEGCGSLANVERIVKQAYAEGVLPNEEQPEEE